MMDIEEEARFIANESEQLLMQNGYNDVVYLVRKRLQQAYTKGLEDAAEIADEFNSIEGIAERISKEIRKKINGSS